MLSTNRLLAAYWSIAGDVYPGGPSEVSPFGFEERVAAAAEAGYRGIGLVHAEIVALRDRLGFARMRAILDSYDMHDIEVEIFSDWFATGDRRRVSDAMRADLLAAAEALRAHHIKVSGDMTGAAWPLPVLADSFGQLCAEAERAGTSVGIEIMPWSNLNRIDNTLAVIEASGARNGGLLLDIWHVSRGKIPLEEIGRVRRDRIISVELDDAAAEAPADLWHDTLHNRLLCGEGTFDIAGFLSQLGLAGYDGPVGVEILSEDHRRRPLQEMAERSIAGAKRAVSRAVVGTTG
jgi:sugar phosphate isomerase/epimerase